MTLSALLLAALLGAADSQKIACRVVLSVASELPQENVPLDPMIDFGKLIAEAGLTGVLDSNSIRVVNAETGEAVEHALSGDFMYGDRGRVEWVVENPAHKRYEIRFCVVLRRTRAEPRKRVPLIGTGDLLRYNAGKPRPVTAYFAVGLADLTGDGRTDLFGCWNYAYRPGDPWNGIICYPRDGAAERFEFGDLARLRYVENRDESPKHFTHTYMACDFADFNRDGLIDLVWTRRGSKTAAFFLNTGEQDAGGMPRFAPAGAVPVSDWEACRAVDLNGDGACDLVVNGQYVKNLNPDGWPFQADKPVALDAGREPCFADLDGDGLLDAVCLHGETHVRTHGESVVPPLLDRVRVAWRRNLGGNPPSFAPPQLLSGVEAAGCTLVAAAQDAGKTLLLVQHNCRQNISIFELIGGGGKPPKFAPRGRAESISAVMALGDQAWPYACDWDNDGDLDLLIGGGHGWPRIVLNEGGRKRPAFAEPKLIEADGRPIRFLRNDILGDPPHWHNMGYSYPALVAWNADDMPDLLFPNETNRIFWYKNIGTRRQPGFGPRNQLLVEGFGDSPETRAVSAQRAQKDTYPREKERPFYWRTGAATADCNGDGLTDLVTLDGNHRRATLFVQFRDKNGSLGLRMEMPLKLKDGRHIDDSIVRRRRHWTESFKACDWDRDGLIDLIYSLGGCDNATQDGGSIYLLRNCGSKTQPLFEPPETFRCFGKPIRITDHGPHVWAGDFDGDGKPDLIACVENSVYPFYRNAALLMKDRPKIELGKLKIHL
ncbi:MAG: VCBS repeat-containing protein [Pirellulaceae bacterium]|nr:VCBS repeat-containing protein [Pirellulaceae bacterium]